MRKIRVMIEAITKGFREAERRTKFLGQAADRTGKDARLLDKTFKGLNYRMTENGGIVRKGTSGFIKQADAVQHLSKHTGRFMNRFKMEYLSFMFFGMAIQQLFLGMQKSATDAYMKMTEGQTEAAQSVLALSAGIEYLKFTLGDAIATTLGPMLPTLLGIIDSITEWINQNPQLAAWLVAIGIIVGTVMFAFGTLVLGINGITMAIGGWIATGGKVAAWFGITKAGLISTMAAAAPIVLILLLIVATIIILWLAWQHNWFNIRQTTGVIIMGIANAFFLLVEAGQMLLSGMMLVWNGILDAVMYAAGPIIEAINAIGGAWAWLNGMDFEPIRLDLNFLKADLQSVNEEIDKWQQGVGQGIYSFGEDVYMQGERMNRAAAGENSSFTQDITVNIENKNEAKDTFDYESEAARIADEMAKLGISGVKYK